WIRTVIVLDEGAVAMKEFASLGAADFASSRRADTALPAIFTTTRPLNSRGREILTYSNPRFPLGSVKRIVRDSPAPKIPVSKAGFLVCRAECLVSPRLIQVTVSPT